MSTFKLYQWRTNTEKREWRIDHCHDNQGFHYSRAAVYTSVKSFPAQNSHRCFYKQKQPTSLEIDSDPVKGVNERRFYFGSFGPLTRSPQTAATWAVSSVSYATLFKRKTKKKKESGRRALRKKLNEMGSCIAAAPSFLLN